MKAYYYCIDCKLTMHRFEVVEAIDTVPSEFWGARSVESRTCLVCPECGEDVEETSVPPKLDVDACCENEDRNLNGGCDSCGDPCL